MAVLYIAVEHFKPVNDSFVHAWVDTLVRMSQPLAFPLPTAASEPFRVEAWLNAAAVARVHRESPGPAGPGTLAACGP